MPEIIHEQKGLTIKKNDINKVVVASLFFYADPIKARPNWIKEASVGMSKADVAKEYYIDYTALQGERMFPEFLEHKNKVIIERPHPDMEIYRQYWMGFDYGTRNPSALYVLAEGKNIEGESSLYVIWEHYEPTKDLTKLCDTIKDCKYYEHVRWIAADPILFAKNQQALMGLTSIGDQMYERGILNILPGKQNEEAFVNYMHTSWGDLGNRAPTFFILDNCPNLIREFENIVYAPATMGSIKSHSPKEHMVNKDNHGLDAIKYFLSLYPGGSRVKKIDTEKVRTSNVIPEWRRHLK